MHTDAKFWDRLADEYSKKPLPNPEATARRMAVVRGLSTPEQVVLDVGCGTGTLLLELAPHITRGEGRDISQAMIAIAQRKAADAGRSHVHFAAAGAQELDQLPDNGFDGIMAFNLLHLVPDAAALSATLFRLLRPGGWFVSQTPCLGGIWLPPYPLILPLLRWVGKAPSVNLLRPAELSQLITTAGFVDLESPEVGGGPTDLFLVARKPS